MLAGGTLPSLDLAEVVSHKLIRLTLLVEIMGIFAYV